SSVEALRSDADRFEKTYGIKVAVTQATSGPLTARIDQEIRGGRMQADVVIAADRHGLYRWIADGQIAKLPDMKFPDRTDHLAQRVAAGEAAVGFTGQPYFVGNIKAASPSAKIDYAYLDVITIAPSYVAVNAKAQNPNAAKLFAAWMMSPAGQEAHNGNDRAS